MAENVVVTINVRDLGSSKVRQFAKNTRDSLAGVSGTVKTTNGVFSNFTSTLAKNTVNAFAVLPAYAAVGAAIGGLTATVATAAKDIVEFDKALRNASSISPELRGSFESIRQEIIKLPPALGTTKEIAEGLYETLSTGISVGLSAADSLKFTADAAKLSKAALIDNATAVKALASTLQAFGAEASRAGQFTDIFQKAVNLGAFTGEELAAVLGRITPIASSLGVSFSETTAAIATLSQTGLSAAESVTALRQILNQAIQNADEFAAAGIDIQKVLAGEDGLVNFFRLLREETGGNNLATKRFIRSVRGLVGAEALLGKQFDLLVKSTEDFKNATGEADIAVAENQKSISAGFDRLRASFDRAVQRFSSGDLAESVSIALGNLGVAIEDAAEGFINFGGAVKFGLDESADFLGISDALSTSLGNLAKRGILGNIFPLKNLAIVYAEATEAGRKLLTGVGDLTKTMEFSESELKEFGDALRGGGLAAAEAFEKIMRARNAALDATRESTQVTRENIGVLQTLSATVDSVGGRLDTAKNAMTNATASLKGIGLEALDTVTKTEQLRAELIKIIQGVNTFDGDLENLAGGLAKNLELTGSAAENVRDLGVRFGQAVSQVDMWREALRNAGATADELSGTTEITLERFQEMSRETGLTVDQLSAMDAQFRIAQIDAESLGNQLRINGVDIQTFKQEVVGLVAEMVRAEQPTLKFAAAMQVLSGITLSQLNAEVNQSAIAIRALAADGTVSTGFLVAETEKLIDRYRQLGLEAPKDIQELQAQLQKTRNETLTTAEAFEILNGTRLSDLQQELATTGAALQKLGGDATLSGTVLAKSVEDFAAKARAIYGEQIPDAIRLTIEQQASLARSTTTVGQAFESLNGITLDSLRRSVAQSIRELDILFVNGKVGSQQMKEEIARLREQVALLGPAGETAFNPMLDALERSLPLAQTLNDSLKTLGAKTITELRSNADLAGKAFLQAFKSGTVSGKELVRVFESEVAPAFEEAGLRIPNSLLLAFEKARSLSAVEAARVGQDIGSILGKNIGESIDREVTNAVGQTINTIANRFKSELRSVSDIFDEIAPGTREGFQTVRFGTTKEELEKNLEDIRRLQSSTSASGPGGASSIQALNKARDEVLRRLREIEEAERKAQEESQRFNETSTSGLNSTSSQALNVSSSFDRITNSINSAGDSLNSFASSVESLNTAEPIEFNPFTSSVPATSGTDTSLTTGISSGGQTGGAFFTGRDPLFGRFQTGIDFARQGQLARLDRGEMVVPRDIAKRLRSLDIRQLQSLSPLPALGQAVMQGAPISSGPRSFVPGTGFVGSIIIGRRSPGSSLANGGFSTIPGFGTVPNSQIANAVGNADQLGGENSQINMQRKIIPLVRGAITRRDLTRDISGATALTNKGQPSTGGS